jgi:hypothetical protein
MNNFTYTYKRHRLLSLGVVALVVAFAAGCASQHAYLVPAPTANLSNGGHAATATAEGVSITVTPNAWNGRPRDLDRRVTPLEVRIENHSKQPIRLVYEDFQLVTPQGARLAALPPSEIRGEYVGENRLPFDAHFLDAAWQESGRRPHADRGRARVIVTPGFDFDGFYYAPYWGYGYLGLAPWPYGWAPNMGYYNTYYPYMRSIHLPTQSMLKKGIPEGVVAPGGYVQGFLYFTKVSPEMSDVEFVASLQDASTGHLFGTVKIPFKVKTRSGYYKVFRFGACESAAATRGKQRTYEKGLLQELQRRELVFCERPARYLLAASTPSTISLNSAWVSSPRFSIPFCLTRCSISATASSSASVMPICSRL